VKHEARFRLGKGFWFGLGLGLGLGFGLGFGCWFRLRLWLRFYCDAGPQSGFYCARRRGFEQATSGGVRGAATRLAFTQCNQRIEDIRAAAAANVSLSRAQIHGRNDQGQRAFRADGEQREFLEGQS
jgi:hypothetical protein